MRYDIVPASFMVKFYLWLGLIPASAFAQETMKNLDPVDLRWWTWCFIFLFANIGWVIAELDKLADIWYLEGKSKRDHALMVLKFGQGFVASNFAGVAAYFAGKSSPDLVGFDNPVPEMLLLLAVTVAGYWGTQVLTKLSIRFGFAKEVP